MPMDKSKYPPNWNEISRGVKDRAGRKCEQCGAPDRKYILRSTRDGSRYVISDPDGSYSYPDSTEKLRVEWLPMEFDDSGLTFVILTTHHKGVPKADGSPGDRGDKMDCRDENLAALCQRCHLLADMDLHVANRKRTHNQKKRQRQLDAGQKELW